MTKEGRTVTGGDEVRSWIVRGRVQGVGFRWWTRQAACALRLTGYVRNQEDGTVRVVAAGGPATLERLERLLGQGPPGARVAEVERDGTSVDGGPSSTGLGAGSVPPIGGDFRIER